MFTLQSAERYKIERFRRGSYTVKDKGSVLHFSKDNQNILLTSIQPFFYISES